jgi:hypothetical protein
MKGQPEAICLGSARVSRAGDRALAIANLSCCDLCGSEKHFGEGAEIRTRGACAPQNGQFAVCSARST